MILRLSQKLNNKIKAGKLSAVPLEENPYGDWSCHLFTADRVQYILMSNTASLYSCVMYGREIPDDGTFIVRFLDTIRDFTADDGQQFVYRKFIAPSSETVTFAKALNRSVTGSMNELIEEAKRYLLDDMAPSEVGYRLNTIPLKALTNKERQKYAVAKEVFKRLAKNRNP